MSPHAINIKDKRNIKVGIVALRQVSKWTDKAALTLEKFEKQQGAQHVHSSLHSHSHSQGQSKPFEAEKAQIEEQKVEKQHKKEKLRYWLPLRGKKVEKVTAVAETVEVKDKPVERVKAEVTEKIEVSEKGHIGEKVEVQVKTETKKSITVLEVPQSKGDLVLGPKEKTVVMKQSAEVVEVCDTDEEETEGESDEETGSDEKESDTEGKSDSDNGSATDAKSDTEDDSNVEDKNEEEEKTDAEDESGLEDESDDEQEIQVQEKPEVGVDLKQNRRK